MGKLVQVVYGACEWMNPDVEGGVQALQAAFLHSCAHQMSPKTHNNCAVQGGYCL